MKFLLLILLITYISNVFSIECNLNATFDVISNINGKEVNKFGTNLSTVKYLHGKKLTILNGNVFKLCSAFVNNFAHIVELEFDQLQLEDIELRVFDGLKDLKSLKITNNNLMEIPSNIFNKLKIEKLDLQRNNIFSIYYEALDDMPNLKYLNLDFNKLSVIEPNWSASKPALTYFSLRYNDFTELQSDSFKNIGTTNNCKFIKNNCPTIVLSNNKINEVYVDAFGGLKKINEIIMDRNDLYDLPVFPEGMKVKRLSVEYNKISLIYRNYIESYLIQVNKTYMYGNPIIYKNQLYLDEVNDENDHPFVYYERRQREY